MPRYRTVLVEAYGPRLSGSSQAIKKVWYSDIDPTYPSFKHIVTIYLMSATHFHMCQAGNLHVREEKKKSHFLISTNGF